jgi:hypothetical protein
MRSFLCHFWWNKPEVRHLLAKDGYDFFLPFNHLNWVLFWLVWFSHKAVMNFHATPLLLQVSDILICNVPTADLEKDVSPCFFFACVVWWQALDIVPKKIHDRSPIFLGSYDDIEDIKNLYAACAKETF